MNNQFEKIIEDIQNKLPARKNLKGKILRCKQECDLQGWCEHSIPHKLNIECHMLTCGLKRCSGCKSI